MTSEEGMEHGEIQFHISVVKNLVQTVLQYGHFIAFKVKVKEFTLFHVGKTVQPCKIIVYGVDQQLFDLAPVKIIFIKGSPDLTVCRPLFQVGHSQRD